ncbi:Bol1p [Rhodotorula paludigena]|uniref:Bol1p n=1 Tax=Rhodotorula paludigena TaxID=86838 RepID=UPI00317AE2F5
MSAHAQAGPVESAIREKLTAALEPKVLSITNDSHAHRHHAPMKGNTNPETHFTVQVKVIQRHRLVNDTLKPLFDEGLHALAIRAKSPSEYDAA